MPDKKLTDNEIIKALECCAELKPNPCSQCPYFHTKPCLQLKRDALDLINRLQAENEALKREIEDLESVQEISPEAKYLVDTKADKVISLLTKLNKSQEQIKAEAYKQCNQKTLMCLDKFREEIVDKFIIMCDGNDYNKLNLMSMVDTIDCIYNKHIDNLLKEEKVGDSE